MLILFLKTALLFGVLLTAIAYVVWVERRVLGVMQARLGPNRVGFGILATLPVVGRLFRFTEETRLFGLGQPIADGLKLFTKEGIEPAGVDPWTYRLAPILGLLPVFLGFAVVPIGPDVPVLGRIVTTQIADLPVGVIYLLAVGSLGSYSVVLAGWSSNSKFSFLGGLRAAAQMISYELPMGIAILTVVMLTGTLSLREIVAAQGDIWNLFRFPPFLILAFVISTICAVAEANRAPFDLPEAESELVGGFHTEYSGMKFALFFLAEYAHIFLGGSILAVLFLGGWNIPFIGTLAKVLPVLLNPWVYWILGVLSFALKVFAYVFFCIWLRATLPRFRYDQLMNFTWKVLTPLAAFNLLAVAVLGKLL